MSAAEYLFNIKGYESASLNDIAKRIGIAKGTLYYYFETKEDILNAVAERFCSNIISMENEIANDDSMDCITKIKKILLKEFQYDRKNKHMLDNLHHWENIKIHQKIFILMIEQYSHIFAKIIKQGIEEGEFKTEFPLDTVQFIMAGYRMLFDPTHFSWSDVELRQKLKVAQHITLKIPQGKLPLLEKVLPKNSARLFTRTPYADMSICSHCNVCVKLCPMGAIDNETLEIDEKQCFRCFCCVKRCPKKARKIIYKPRFIVSKVLTMKNRVIKEPKMHLL